jgi:SAM-dependent methyltransferase
MSTTGQGTASVQGELWGARPSDWAEQERQSIPLYREAIARTGIGPGSKILDLGCASGVFAQLAAEAGAQVSGLDASEALVALATERVPGGEFRVGDLQFLPYSDDTFDAVTAFNSIQYAADPAAAAAEAKRVTRPGGSVFVVVWGREEQTELVAVLRALRPLLPPAPEGAPGPFALSYPGALERILQAGGLAIEAEGYLEAPFEYRDEESMLRANLSSGVAVLAARTSGEDAVRQALAAALAPFRTSSGGYRIDTEWRFVHARA